MEEVNYNAPPTYDEGRKQHVRVSQDLYLTLLRDLEDAGAVGELADIAEFFDVAEATARRHLDGLVAQGLAQHPPGTSIYLPT